MGRDDQLAGLINGADDAGQEVGEGFADAGAGFKEQGGVVFHRGGYRPRHLLLLGPVLETQSLLQPAALGEQFRGENRCVADGWGRGAGFVAEANHIKSGWAPNQVRNSWRN